MGDRDLTYKAGAWKMSLAEAPSIFDKDRLIISCIEKLKSDIENLDPKDKKAQSMISELLYHYCWKIAEDE